MPQPPFIPEHEIEFLQRHEPGFIERLEAARREAAGPEERHFVLELGGWQHSSTRHRLNACLWYALKRGMMVTVAPPGMQAEFRCMEQSVDSPISSVDQDTPEEIARQRKQ